MSERSRLYQNEITRLGHGHPVWEPNPGTLYDRVRIGDVGYFDMGQFIPIFNILPPDDEQHNRGLPFPQHNFPLLYLPSGLPHSRNRTPLEAGVHSLESNSTHFATIGINSVASVLRGDFSLSFTKEKGAALILPSQAIREDTLYVKAFQTHMVTYHRDWYRFAVEDCRRQINLCDLILVTGCDLTSQWTIATYFATHRGTSAALGAQVAPLASAGFSISAGRTALEGMHTRGGPPEALDNQANDEGSQNESDTLDNNQCVFVRGLSIKERLWGPKVIKAGAGYHDPGRYGPEEEGAAGVLGGEDSSTQDETFITVLLDYMLEKSTADVVIASESDLVRPYIEEANNPQHLRDILKMMSPRINVEDGVGTFLPRGIEAGESVKRATPERTRSALATLYLAS